jgi:hypothetical protein
MEPYEPKHTTVFKAYAWTIHLTDDQILERLLALNIECAYTNRD